jgi:nicotinate-nucleotide pyrophosphorylase (carboxylating)
LLLALVIAVRYSCTVSDNLAALPSVRRLVELALDEDYGRGDVTTASTVDATRQVVADMTARKAIVVYGLDVAASVFAQVDPAIDLERHVADGDRVDKNTILLTARGPASGVLAAERTALNFVQRLSGVATQARRYADAIAGTRAKVVDTRKTTPGFRVLEKAAVVAGGCANHRFDLASGVLIKDNHIVACGSVGAAVERARARAPHSLTIEVEVTSMAQLEQALAAGADIVLLDNMSPQDVKACVERAHADDVIVEVSGGITLDTIKAYADAGADLISVGALTHSAPAVDIGLDFRTS